MLDKLYRLVNNDKFMHFVYGVALYGVFVPFGKVFALAATLLVAISKEIYDKKGYGVYEAKDAGATVLGGLSLLIWYEVIEYVLRVV